MFRVIKIRLVEGLALGLIDSPGVSMPELRKIRGVEIYRLGLLLRAVERHGKVGAVERYDRPGAAVLDPLLVVGAGELHPITHTERKAAVRRLDLVTRAKLAALFADAAQRDVKPVNVLVGRGQHKAGLAGGV